MYRGKVDHKKNSTKPTVNIHNIATVNIHNIILFLVISLLVFL